MGMKWRTSGLFVLTFILFGCMNGSRTANIFSRVESMMEDAPDSALVLLRGISAKGLHSRAERARYALLYAEVEDRVGLETGCDSLLVQARRYYRKQSDEVRDLCKTLYYLGRSKLRQGDRPGALRLFLEAEEKKRQFR